MDREKVAKEKKERLLEPVKALSDQFVAGDLPKEPDEQEAAEPQRVRMERIRERAYTIWLDEGQFHGRDEEHWREAEQEIDRQDAASH